MSVGGVKLKEIAETGPKRIVIFKYNSTPGLVISKPDLPKIFPADSSVKLPVKYRRVKYYRFL